MVHNMHAQSKFFIGGLKINYKGWRIERCILLYDSKHKVRNKHAENRNVYNVF